MNLKPMPITPDPGPREAALQAPSEHPPKLLPWLARKSGLGEARALALWHQARQESPATPAMARFLDLIEAERRPAATSPAAWLALYDRAWRGNTLLLADALLAGMHNARNNWGRVAAPW